MNLWFAEAFFFLTIGLLEQVASVCLLTNCFVVFGSDAPECSFSDPVVLDVSHQLLQHLLPVATCVLHTCNSN